jgi:hypothetical protein
MALDIIRTPDRVKLTGEEIKQLVLDHVAARTGRVPVTVAFHAGRGIELGAATIELAFNDDKG